MALFEHIKGSKQKENTFSPNWAGLRHALPRSGYESGSYMFQTRQKPLTWTKLNQQGHQNPRAVWLHHTKQTCWCLKNGSPGQAHLVRTISDLSRVQKCLTLTTKGLNSIVLFSCTKRRRPALKMSKILRNKTRVCILECFPTGPTN